ncbi:nitroreductase family deazaflavin-dependent oxidoreductase [Streptomyces sp. SYSU K217416]
MAHYIKPNRFDQLLNRTIGLLARRGISLAGTNELAVRGRKSGEWRRVPVNPLPYEGGPYLVSARGHSEWVRNLRAAGGGQLRVGRKTRSFTAVELTDDEKPQVLRSYLERWGWEVGRFFGEVNAKSPDEQLRAAAPRHPVFRITVTR